MTAMKGKKPTLKQVQAVRCPTCGARAGEKCELSTGQPRSYPHRDRRLIAANKRTETPLISEGEMSCKECQAENQRNLNGEIAIHFPGLKGLSKPIIWVFPKILVCLDCGFTEFAIPETELRRLAESDAAGA